MHIFRNIMAAFGIVIFMFGAAFGLALISKDFRALCLKSINAIHISEYEQVVDENKSLQEEIDKLLSESENKDKEHLEEIEKIKEEFKEEYQNKLQAKLEEIELLKQNYESQIVDLEEQIIQLEEQLNELEINKDEISKKYSELFFEKIRLNSEINKLNKQFENISTNIDGLTISYDDSYSRVQYTVHDGQSSWTENLTGSANGYLCYMGNDLENVLNEYNDGILSLKNSLNNDIAYVHAFDFYIVHFVNPNLATGVEVEANTYEIDFNATIEIQIKLNGNKVDLSTISTQIDDGTFYNLNIDYNYTLDDNNKVNYLTCEIIIESQTE